MRDICNDADLVDGIIRQRSNDKSCIFEIDMTNLLNKGNMTVIQLKQKLDLFKIFTGQDVEINITEADYTFSDQYSSISFLLPNMNYIDNKYMGEEELENIFSLNEEDLILETTISTEISERIKTIATSFNTTTLEIEFSGDTAEVVCATQAADQKAKVVRDIVTNRNIEETSTNLVIIPFISDHDGDMTLSMYNIKDDIIVNKFSSSVGGINYTIYSRSMMIKEED